MKVDLSVSIVLVVLAGVHIAEEAAAGFRRFFNTEWFKGNQDCPVGRTKGLLIDQIGLFVLLATLAIMGALIEARLLLVAVGIIIADSVQHVVFSIAKGKYTPGVATTALYLLYMLYFFGREELRSVVHLDWAWLAMATGLAFIAANYLVSSITVRLGRCGNRSLNVLR